MEVDMARRVDQIDLVAFSLVIEAHRYAARFDRDAALPLKIHVVEHLVAHFARFCTVPVVSRIRSANVLLPWSIWATMQKLRICEQSTGMEFC